jgi:histidinol-phosphate aminotransferase
MDKAKPELSPTSIARLVRREVLELVGYEACEPVDVLADEFGIPADRIVKLDANENPYGPSPRVIEALADFDLYHIYPDPEQRRVRRALADHLSVGMDHIVVGSGSDELLELIARLFLSPVDAVVNCTPTFGMYPFVSQLWGARVVEVPRREDFGLDVAAVRRAVSDGAKLVFIASPNNPTGNVAAREEVEGLLSAGALVVLDEAYVEFSGQSLVSQVPRHDNLVVLRTFSKWAGLAGLRIGYGIFPKAVAGLVARVKSPYNLNVAGQVAALASLEDVATLRERVQAIVDERGRLLRGLAGLPFLRPYPSEANFILCRAIDLSARDVWECLRQHGIFVRYYDTSPIEDCIRISVGKPEHSERLLSALAEIGGSLAS